MDYLKSAVASAISKGSSIPYTFGDRVDVDQTVFSLYNGTKKEDGSSCSIFSFDIAANKSRVPLARNALRKFRTLRHPGVVKVLDTIESESHIYIFTEKVTPLGWHIRRKSLGPEIIKWGLCSAAKTLKFINEEASSVHGSLRVSSIFTSESGEWKIGGFEILSSMKDDDAIIYNYGSLVPDSQRFAPPEVAASGWEAIKRYPLSAPDAYNFGTLIFEAFNGSFNGKEQAGQTKGIPPSMHQSYKRLVMANPKTRLSIGHFLDQGRRSGGFFETLLIRITEGVESLGVKTESEREELLGELAEISDDFPEDFFKMKVLPELLKSAEFGGGGPKVFGLIMKIGSKLSDEEFESRITPVIIRLFASPDRAIRVCLLDNLPLMIERLPQKLVNDKIFPQMVSGFMDVAPIVREQTVKAVLVIITKLSDRTINGELLKYLAKTANDEQPGLRTNTTICLGRIAPHLGQGTRTKVLMAAFSRSLRDPFVHARNASLMALAATAEFFAEDDCATKLLPAVCPSLVDKEKLVRDQANKTLDAFLLRIRKHALSLPDTVLPPPSHESTTGGAPRMSTPANGTSWAGWAVSSFTNKLAGASGEIQQSTNRTGTASPANRPSSAPPDASTRAPAPASATASTLHRQALISPKPSLSQPTKAASTYFDNPNIADTPENEDDVDAWGEMEEDSFFDAPAEAVKEAPPPMSYDDGGEPDFAGWLNAQAKGKKDLPKGLAKTAGSNGRPSMAGHGASTGGITSSAATKKPIVKAAAPTTVKKVDIKPKEEEGDDWGAWD